MAKIQKMNQEYKILFFVSLCLVFLNLSDSLGLANLNSTAENHDWRIGAFNHFNYRDLPIIIFLNLLIPVISCKNKFSIYHPVIGSMSAISMAWGIDRGAYLNLVLFFLILFLSLRRDFKKSSFILLGAITSWVIFYIFFW